ncbi:MAG: epoxyqueuosine reductase QueH [Candidatus Goldbacteria bacterium]|nr:epoxyqueuosine reductase QueH [Candidatus Goldiibacteriota bacterium]
MKKILLNVCCAPDATHSINVLQEEGFHVITYFYNPNIHPENEYKRRFLDMIKLAKQINIENITHVPYDLEEWKKRCDKYAGEKEGGKRCIECFKLRLKKTAEKAKELGIEIFATTLTISPHKNAELINKIGKEIANEFGIKYYESNFKKKDGFKKSIELSKKYNLYRQNYCGCVYSQRDVR